MSIERKKNPLPSAHKKKVTRKNSLPLQEVGDDQEAHTCNTCIMTAL